MRLVSAFGEKMGEAREEVSGSEWSALFFSMFQLKFRVGIKGPLKIFPPHRGAGYYYTDRLKLWGEERSLLEIEEEMN